MSMHNPFFTRLDQGQVLSDKFKVNNPLRSVALSCRTRNNKSILRSILFIVKRLLCLIVIGQRRSRYCPIVEQALATSCPLVCVFGDLDLDLSCQSIDVPGLASLAGLVKICG